MGLQMGEAHFDPFPLIARFQECLGLHFATRDVAGTLVDVAYNPARRPVRTALLFQLALPAAGYRREVPDRVIIVDPATRRQGLARRTGVDVPPTVEFELGPHECAIVPPAHVPHRDVRDNAGASDESEKSTGPVRRVGREPFGIEVEASSGAFDHYASGRHLIVSERGCRLDVNNNGVLDIDQIVQAVAEQHTLVGFGRPGRRWITWRDHLWRLAVRSKFASAV